MEKFIAQRFAPVGYAAEYLIPSLSDVLATIALPHSVTYLLRGVNGETLDLHQSQPNHAVRHISQYVKKSTRADFNSPTNLSVIPLRKQVRQVLSLFAIRF